MKRQPAPTPPARSVQTRNAHPLLGAFPLAVMTLATFMVLFALTMARLKADAGTAVRTSPGTALLAESPRAGTATGDASAGNSATEARQRTAPQPSHTPAAIVARASAGSPLGHTAGTRDEIDSRAGAPVEESGAD